MGFAGIGRSLSFANNAMPGCQFLYVQLVVGLMAVVIAAAAGVARLIGGSASRMALRAAMTCAAVMPFLFLFRTAVYDGVLAARDTSLGWPFIYAHAQYDADMIWVSSGSFFCDLSIGMVAAVAILFLYRGVRRRSSG